MAPSDVCQKAIELTAKPPQPWGQGSASLASIHIQRGLRRCSSLTNGHARASTRGTSNRLKSHALFVYGQKQHKKPSAPGLDGEKNEKAMCKRTEITDVSSYLQWIKNMEMLNTNSIFPGYSMYYRGHPSSAYKLAQSLFRTSNKTLVKKEHILLQKAKFALGEKATGLDSLSLLSTFQHYGLITRLLDVTTNPFIALFFACQESIENEKEGIVYCGYPKEGNSIEKASIIASFSFIQNGDLPCEINAQSRKLGFNNDYIKSVLCHSYFFTPPISNERIISQKGGFLIAPYLEISDINNSKATNFEYKIGETECFLEEQAIVHANKKTNILEELSNYGYNDGSIFPDLQHKLSAINKEVIYKQQAIDNSTIEPLHS